MQRRGRSPHFSRPLHAFLRKVDESTSQYVTGVSEFCPPVLIVDEGLTLSPPYDMVEEAYERAGQSQVGTETETVINLDARRSREYDNVRVLDEDGVWEEYLASVCAEVRQNLAPQALAVSAELYKLLLYKEGDFFNAHQDAKRSGNMFASLLFFVPCEHKGGDFELWLSPHKDRWGGRFINPLSPPAKDTMDPSCGAFGAGSRSSDTSSGVSGCPWVAFYTDTKHRVDRVTSGYRIALNYSLKFEGSMTAGIDDITRSFVPSSVLADLKNDVKTCMGRSGSTTLLIPLRHKYTEATLDPTFLEGGDAYLFGALQHAGVDITMQFYLQVDEAETGPRDEEGERDWWAEFGCLYLLGQSTVSTLIDKDKTSGKAHRHDRIRRELLMIAAACQYEREEGFDMTDLQLFVPSSWMTGREDGSCRPQSPLAFCRSDETLGWLGNMTPSAEMYYVSTALVISRAKEGAAAEKAGKK